MFKFNFLEKKIKQHTRKLKLSPRNLYQGSVFPVLGIDTLKVVTGGGWWASK